MAILFSFKLSKSHLQSRSGLVSGGTWHGGTHWTFPNVAARGLKVVALPALSTPGSLTYELPLVLVVRPEMKSNASVYKLLFYGLVVLSLSLAEGPVL